MDNFQTSLDTIFHALADSTRRAVIQQLGQGNATISELAEPFGYGVAIISETYSRS